MLNQVKPVDAVNSFAYDDPAWKFATLFTAKQKQ